MSNPMHVESVMIVEAMNAQTSAIIETQKKTSQDINAQTSAIIEAQQKASHDTALSLAKLLKVDKSAESL